MDYFVSPHTLSNIAAAIRYELGTSELFSVSEFPSKINQIDMDIFDKLNNKTISRYSNSKITKIGEGAFYSCTNLRSVDLPLVSQIESLAFYYCYNLSWINVPRVKIIQYNAFNNCNLTSISLPSIVQIYANAFQSCTNLSSVYITATSIPSLGYSGFPSNTNLSIFVLSSLLSSYKVAEQWSNYASKIFGI